MLAACSDKPLTLLPTSSPGAEARQLSRTGSEGHQSVRMIAPERRGRQTGNASASAEMLSAVPDSCTHRRAQHSPPHKVLLVRAGLWLLQPPQPLSLFGERVERSLQELGKTVGAGNSRCSRHSAALWVGSGQRGPPWAQATPRGATQLLPAVWKHVLCPALTQYFESRRITELGNSTVWKRWVDAHCWEDAGRTSSVCGIGAPEGFGKGRSP